MTTLLIFVLLFMVPQAAPTQAQPTPAERAVIAAEKAGASFPYLPFLGDAPPVRKCTIVKPEQIVFPATKGDPADYNLSSGEFWAGSLSFGWGDNYEQGKMPLRPRHDGNLGSGLRLVLSRIDSGSEQYVQTYQPLSNKWFATWPRFPTPGRWMILATAGVNWGCFVFDRPVKTVSRAFSNGLLIH